VGVSEKTYRRNDKAETCKTCQNTLSSNSTHGQNRGILPNKTSGVKPGNVRPPSSRRIDGEVIHRHEAVVAEGAVRNGEVGFILKASARKHCRAKRAETGKAASPRSQSRQRRHAHKTRRRSGVRAPKLIGQGAETTVPRDLRGRSAGTFVSHMTARTRHSQFALKLEQPGAKQYPLGLK